MGNRTPKLPRDGGSEPGRQPDELLGPPRTWSEFVALRERIGPVPDDFLVDREQPVEVGAPFIAT